MNGIALNNQYLHQVEMLLTPYGNNTVSYLKYPPHRIKYEIEGDKLFLKLPVSLALELYRTAILPQKSEIGVPIKIDNKEVGKFQVIDLRYANSVTRERDEVSITFNGLSRTNDKAPHTQEPDVSKEASPVLKQRWRGRPLHRL